MCGWRQGRGENAAGPDCGNFCEGENGELRARAPGPERTEHNVNERSGSGPRRLALVSAAAFIAMLANE
ncbi:unnamed protein product [Lampetra fluviatilis]